MLVGSRTKSREPSGIFEEDQPGSRRAYRSAISSEHDSVLRLAWAVQRGGEKPVGGRAVNGYYRKQESTVSGNLARMSERHGAIMSCGVFLSRIEGVGAVAARNSEYLCRSCLFLRSGADMVKIGRSHVRCREQRPQILT